MIDEDMSFLRYGACTGFIGELSGDVALKHALRILVISFTALLPFFLSSSALAKDVVLYVYGQVPGTPQGWALLPTVASIETLSGAAVFDALRRKKLPTYGDTQFDAKTSSVTIDPSKCAYSAIIATELARSFEQNGLGLSRMTCGGMPVVFQAASLAHSVSVIPVWQALEAAQQAISPRTYVDLGSSLMPYETFRSKLASGDKAVMKAVETAMDSESDFVQRQTMVSAIQANLSGAESMIAKRLASKSVSVRANAVRALRTTSQLKIRSQIRDVLRQATPEEKLVLAESALGAEDEEIRRMAARSLLATSDEALFLKAMAVLTPSDIAAQLDQSLDLAATPAHAAAIARTQFSADLQPLRAWLDKQQGTARAVSVADAVLQASLKDVALVASAHAVMMLSEDFERAEASFYLLTGRTLFDTRKTVSLTEPMTAALVRAQASGHILVSWAAFDLLQPAISLDPAYDVAGAQKRAFDSDWKIRAALAHELVRSDASADALRSALIKDSEPRVVHAMIDSLARTASTRFAREVIQIAKMKDVQTRTLMIRAMPDLLDDTNATAVMAFVSNELFDANAEVKIAALYALSQIARRSKDPVVIDNAISSMSLTVQDKDPRIVHHTLLALAETGHASVYPLLDATQPRYPESVLAARMRLAQN